MPDIAEQIGKDILNEFDRLGLYAPPRLASPLGQAAIDSVLKNLDDRVPITAAEKKCLAFIDQYIKASGISPSYREIMEALGLKSTSGIDRVVHQLAERGLVNLLGKKGRARGIVLTRLAVVTLGKDRV